MHRTAKHELVERLRCNSFRLLGLTSCASRDEVDAAARRFRRQMSLGAKPEAPPAVLGIPASPLDESQLKEVLARLATPVDRCVERATWFWSETGLLKSVWDVPPGTSGVEPPVIAAHDAALAAVMRQIQSDPDLGSPDDWTRALVDWSEALDELCEVLPRTDVEGEFEPPVGYEVAEEATEQVFSLACEYVASRGRAAVASGEHSVAGAALDVLREAWSANDRMQRSVLSGLSESVRSRCEAISTAISAQVVREDDAAERNASVCEQLKRRFEQELGKDSETLSAIARSASFEVPQVQSMRVDIAVVARRLASAITWANDFEGALHLLEGAKRQATSSEALTNAINKDIREVASAAKRYQEQLEYESVYGTLQPIDSAPSLSTINGIGFRVYGKSDYHAGTRSYLTTHYFCVFFVPLFPVARYRVVDRDRGYAFIGRAPLRSFDRWHIAASLAAIVLFFVAVGGSDQSRGSASPRRAQPASVRTNPTPRTTPPVRSSPTRVFSNPSAADRREMTTLQVRIDSLKKSARQKELDLDAQQSALDTLRTEIEELKGKLGRWQRMSGAGITVSGATYEASRRRHNELVATFNRGLETYNSDFAEYERTIEAVNRDVARYNLLLERGR